MLGACDADAPTASPPPRSRPSPSAVRPVTSGPTRSTPSAKPPIEEKPDPAEYAWLVDDSARFAPATETLFSRFPAPPGYERVPLEPRSFGEWLRHLPVAAPSTPVTTFEGQVVYPADDRYVAGVLAVDVGESDLQHGPDVVIRLHAEWLWARKRLQDISYRASARLDMPFERWMRGERITARGGEIAWLLTGKPAPEPTHAQFRDYLSTVFNWVNSRSLIAQATRVEPHALRPGDFWVHDGKPGDAILLVDMARDVASGRTLAMLCRAMKPAHSIHVVSPGAGIAWFEVSASTPVLTPRTEAFSWSGLSRLD